MSKVELRKINGEYRIYYVGHTGNEARERLLDECWTLEKNPEGRDFWWRATSNKKEDTICATIQSTNHATGEKEKGLSVAEGVSYFYLNETFKYIYPVTGDIIGTGSDGEPILANAKALAKPSKVPSKRYLEKEKAFNLLSPEVEKLQCKLFCGITLINGESTEGELIIATW